MFPRILTALLCAGLVIGGSFAPALGHQSSPPARPAPGGSASVHEAMTRSLLNLNAQYHAASAADRPQLLARLVALAESREQALLALVETDPRAVLRVAVPASVRAAFPAEAQAHLEEQGEIEGTLEILHEDRTTGSRYRHALETAAGRLTLHFAGEPSTLPTDTQVRVRGVRVDSVMALDSAASIQPVVTIAPNTFGPQPTVVILVKFQDKSNDPYTVSSAKAVAKNTSDFFRENSYGQTWLTGVRDTTAAADVFGWFTIPQDSTVCDYSATATFADQAAQAAGVDLSVYRRKVYAFSQNACTWWGLGTVGGNPSRAWINGSLQLRVMGHEMGHNFGDYHSHSQDCDATSCIVGEYGDGWDIMGSTVGHLNPFQKTRLGWLGHGVSPPVTVAQVDGIYSLDPYVTPGAGPKALIVLKSTDPTTGKRTWYYLENRQRVGFDSNLPAGVVIRTGSEATGNSSYLFDLANTTTLSDSILDVGQSFTDAAAGVTFTTLSANASGAAIQAIFGSAACVPGTPIVTASPSATQWTQPGTALSYSVSVKSADSTGCAPSTFDLGAAIPSGWTGAFGNTALTIGAGGTGSTTLQLASPSAASLGFYTTTMTATSAAGRTSSPATVTVNLVDGLGVQVSTDQTSYSRNQFVTAVARVTSGGAPAAGVSVNFTVMSSTGAVIARQTVTTNAAGSASFRFKLNHKVKPDQYWIEAIATLGALAGEGDTTFTVR